MSWLSILEKVTQHSTSLCNAETQSAWCIDNHHPLPKIHCWKCYQDHNLGGERLAKQKAYIISVKERKWQKWRLSIAIKKKYWVLKATHWTVPVIEQDLYRFYIFYSFLKVICFMFKQTIRRKQMPKPGWLKLCEGYHSLIQTHKICITWSFMYTNLCCSCKREDIFIRHL